jgi:predicted ATPase
VTRPDPFEDRPAWARRIRKAAVLRLAPLSGAASKALLEALSGGRLDQDEERRIAQVAGGNPLFLEQLVAYVGERRSADDLPPAIHALLAARLNRLDTVERSVLALGAVAGDAFQPATVRALAGGVARAEVEQACHRLVEHDLLTEEPGGEGMELRFRHTLIRDTAYATLTKSARARLHERHAAWLAGLGGGVPEADARTRPAGRR